MMLSSRTISWLIATPRKTKSCLSPRWILDKSTCSQWSRSRPSSASIQDAQRIFLRMCRNQL